MPNRPLAGKRLPEQRLNTSTRRRSDYLVAQVQGHPSLPRREAPPVLGLSSVLAAHRAAGAFMIAVSVKLCAYFVIAFVVSSDFPFSSHYLVSSGKPDLPFLVFVGGGFETERYVEDVS